MLNFFKNKKSRSRIFLPRPKYIDRHKGKTFLVLANGPSILGERKKVELFIKEKSPLIIACNKAPEYVEPDYQIFVNRRRFCDYYKSAAEKTKLILSPYFTKQQVESRLKNRPFEYCGFRNKYPSAIGKVVLDNNIVKCNGATVSIVAVGIAILMGADKVYIAGMDGYSKCSKDTHYYREDDNKIVEELFVVEKLMQECLDDLRAIANKRNVGLKFLTSTAFSF